MHYGVSNALAIAAEMRVHWSVSSLSWDWPALVSL
jgi:hypothetical protein